MKRLFSFLIVLILCISLVGCVGAEKDIDECSWDFVNAFNVFSVQGGYSIAESINNKPENPDERVDYINCIMTANDGVFSIYDKTNDVIYGGTYRLQSIQPEVTNYIIKINNAEGRAVSGTITYADGSTTNTLIISISEYTLTFYESK
ncbi:MAG: hypothetical protein IJF26_00505 [Clostridia bacterium]|nr:hypothetical protein [Clostridia bacterium]